MCVSLWDFVCVCQRACASVRVFMHVCAFLCVFVRRVCACVSVFVFVYVRV